MKKFIDKFTELLSKIVSKLPELKLPKIDFSRILNSIKELFKFDFSFTSKTDPVSSENAKGDNPEARNASTSTSNGGYTHTPNGRC